MGRDWFRNLDEIDKDCVLQYEFLLGRHLKSFEEYKEIDSQVDDMVLDLATRKRFFEDYPGLKKYANERVLENLDKVKYRYLVVAHTAKGMRYLPSNSRNVAEHIEERNADACWVYDKDGDELAFAKKDKETGEIYYPRLDLDKGPSKYYADLLEVFSDRRLCFNKLEGLKANANFYMGHGKNKALLECGDAKTHISVMKSIWLAADEKTRESVMSWDEVLGYEKALVGDVKKVSLEDQMGSAAKQVSGTTKENKKSFDEYSL